MQYAQYNNHKYDFLTTSEHYELDADLILTPFEVQLPSGITDLFHDLARRCRSALSFVE